MLFTSIDFVIFFFFVLLTYWSLKNIHYQNFFLLQCSLFFYGYADWRFLSLILACAITGYLCAIAIERHKFRKKSFLIIGIIIPMGILFTFKYFNFFIGSFDYLLKSIGLSFQKPILSLLLPIGISFFTFQTVGYLVDVYRGEYKAERNFIDFLLFVTFFPQLVAGPIERAPHLLPQIKNKRNIHQDDIFYGVYQILQGFIKKMVIADNLAPIVNSLFGYPNLSGPLVLVGLIAFAFQIYGDFSGYTDIARGTARLMGFKILLNFNHPYMSLSPTDFWRRWHITLSHWFRDYLYIPLGGNRKGPFRIYINLMITWILCGLWHGSSFNFVLWGGFHGIALVFHKLYLKATQGALFKEKKAYIYLARTVTFVIVLFGWMFFRITDTSRIWDYSRAIFTDWSSIDVAFLTLLQISQFLFLMIAVDYFEGKFIHIMEEKIHIRWELTPYFAALILLLTIFIPDTSGDFIYFKF
jgi:alginate O-acetyltransferase complex protein AlgI